MLKAVTRIMNLPTLIPVILIENDLNSSKVISFLVYLLYISLIDNVIDSNDKVGIKCHKDEFPPSELSSASSSSGSSASNSSLLSIKSLYHCFYYLTVFARLWKRLRNFNYEK